MALVTPNSEELVTPNSETLLQKNGMFSKIKKLFRKDIINGEVTTIQLYTPLPDAEFRKEFYHKRVDRIRRVLMHLQLTHLESIFIQMDVGEEELFYLTDADLVTLGVTKIGDRCRIRRYVKEGGNGSSFYQSDEDNEQLERQGTSPEGRNGINVQMAERSQFQMGDRDNNITTKQNIHARDINSIGNNGALGISMPGMGGLSGPGGNININMGDGASLHGLARLGKGGDRSTVRNGLPEDGKSVRVRPYTWKNFGNYCIYVGHVDDVKEFP